MKYFKLVSFFFLVFAALATSGHAAYVVLTESLDTPAALALLAAIVIDLAAIWLGTHAAELAKLGDTVTKVRLATGFVIVASLTINFFYGYTTGTWVTGLLSCIYPLIAAIVYEFWIEHKIRDAKRSRGLILPEKSIFLNNKFQDKSAVRELHKYEARLSLEAARVHVTNKYIEVTRGYTQGLQVTDTELQDNMVTANEVTQLQDTGLQVNNVTVTQLQDTGLQVNNVTVTQLQELQDVTVTGYKGTKDVTVTDTMVTEDATVTELQDMVTEDATVTELQDMVTEDVTPDLVTQIESVTVGVTQLQELQDVPDWLTPGMNTSAICIACVTYGVTDLNTVFSYVNLLNGDEVARNTVKTSLSRAKKKVNCPI